MSRAPTSANAPSRTSATNQATAGDSITAAPLAAVASTHEAAAVGGAATTARAACPAAPGAQIQIGYEPSLAFLAQDRNAPVTRIQSFLRETFPGSEYQLVYRSYFRDDLPINVANGNVDFAILELGVQNSMANVGMLSLSDQPSGLKIVTIPAGYAAMAGRNQTSTRAPVEVTSPVQLTFALLFTLAASAFLLSTVAYILNLRPPTPDRWSRSVVTLVDPMLSRWTRAWNWMFTTTTGAIVTGLWCLAGVCLLWLLATPLAQVSYPDVSSLAIAKIDSQFSSKREIYAFRGSNWVKCRRTETCLRDYANNELNALLLGDRETLCWYANQMRLDPPLEFLPDVVIPSTYAILLRDASSNARGSASCATRKLEAALAKWPVTDRPTAGCTVLARQR